MDAVDLPIRPTFDPSQIDKAIAKLKELESKGFTIPINFSSNLEALKADAEAMVARLRGQWQGLASDFSGVNAKLLAELDRLGESTAAARLRRGFASVREEVLVLDNLISQLNLKGDPGAGLARGLAGGRIADIAKSGQAAGDSVSFAGYGETAEKATAAREKFTAAEAQGVPVAAQSEAAIAAESSALKAKALAFEEARAAAAKFQKADAEQAATTQRSASATGADAALQRQRSAALIQAANSDVSLQRQRSAALLAEQRRAATEEAAEAKRQQSAQEALQRQRSASLIRQAKEDERAKATTGFRGIINTVGTAGTFIATYGAIDLAVRGLKSGAEASVEFERKLATLSVIFRGTKEEARDLALATVNVAAGFGQDGIAALEVAKDFARFGGTAGDVVEAVRVVSMAANVAELDLAETSKFFQAIMAGGALETGQLAGVLGMLNTISNTYNVTVKQLLEGLARVAPLAKQAGVGLAELAGFEAVISGRTSRPGQEAGNALKSLFARFEKPQVQGVLESSGIDVKDQSGQLKTASALINELAVQYLKLEGAERTELVVKVAGTQQAARIAALLDGYITSQELAIRASRDLTSSDRENMAVRETLSSQLGTLKTRWEQFWVAGVGAGQSAGLQGGLTNIVKLLSSLLSGLTLAEKGVGKLAGAGEAGLKATLGKTTGGVVSRAFGDIFSPVRTINRDLDDAAAGFKEAFGDKFESDMEASAQALQKFNSEVERLQKLGEADEAAQRLLKTVGDLAEKATPADRESMFRSAATVSSPNDLRKQQSLRDELNALAKAGDFIGVNNKLAAMGSELGADRLKNLQAANAEFDKEIAKQTQALAIQEAKRRQAEGSNDKEAADQATQRIEQIGAAREALRRRQTGSLQEQFKEGEDPEIEIAKKQADKLAKIFTERPKTGHLADLDREIAALQLTNTLQDKSVAQLEMIQRKYALIVDTQENAVRAINNTVTAYGEVSKSIPTLNRTDELTGDRQLIDVKDQLLQLEKARELPILRAMGLSEQEIGVAMANIDAQRQLLQVDRERVDEQLRFAAAVEAAKKGVREAQAVTEFSGGVGRNETERKANLIRNVTDSTAARDNLTGLPLNIAAAQADFAGAGDPVQKAQTLARLKEFGISLQAAENDLVRRRFQIEAEITNERRKQAEEASKNLLMADRETQLRAALAAKFSSERGGKGFSASEFQFFDPATKSAIEKTNPDLLPPELKNHLRELTDESASLRIAFGPLRDSAEAATKALAALQLPTAGVSPPSLSLPAGVDFSQVGGAIDQSGHAVQTAIEVLANGVIGHFNSFAGALEEMNSNIDSRMARLERGSATARIGSAQGAVSVLA